MASDKEYLTYVLEQLAPIDDISFRAMMGEYILYYKGKIWGGIYDNRLLVKSVPAAQKLLVGAPLELPYPGGSKMLLVEEMEDRELLRTLLEQMYDELPLPKRK